ncbi:MAG: hypothetical protein AB7O24_31885 [Kofleriaceae bacterium]
MTRSWIVDALGAESFTRLAEALPGTELQSVLLEVMRRRASARTPNQLVAQYQRDRFVRPAATDLRTSVAIDGHLLAVASDFEAIELSPVAPLGTCSRVALTDQNRVLSALRATEVVSDPTNVLALECAVRLRGGKPAHLATCQRVIRAQPAPDKPGYAQHFRIFVLASGGREQAEHGFTISAMQHHIQTMQRALDRLEHHGFRFGARRVDVLARDDRAAVADRIAEAVGGQRSRLEHPYYSAGIRYQIWVTTADGSQLPLIDGGAFDWLHALIANRRLAFIASGMGAQLVPLAFRREV